MFGLAARFRRWLFGRPRSVGRRVAARYDAARTTDENTKHWANADALGPRASHNPATRLILRKRSRYEVQNNGYALGIVRTLANDVIGTGPRLQMQSLTASYNRQVEAEFLAWARLVDLAGKLRTMREAQAVDGEAFCRLVTNPKLPHRVQLDLRPLEADQVSTPWVGTQIDQDGVRTDKFGNVTGYEVLRQHPGEYNNLEPYESDIVPADQMIHIFRSTRPGQVRGVPETTSSLPLFALLRRFTLAVVTAAEAIAEIGTGVVYTNSAADPDGADASPYDTIELERRMLTVLPDGWQMSQLKPEQPTSTYADFKKEILNECSRPWSMPFNITACNSSGYNYASGRLDHQTYYKQISIERSEYENKVLDRIFAAWLDEALLIANYLPPLGAAALPGAHTWFWDGSAHVDPSKESAAQAQRLANLTTTLADEYGQVGKDWETQLRQAAKERALLAELGLPIPGQPPAAAPASDAEEVGAAEDSEDDRPANVNAADEYKRDDDGRFGEGAGESGGGGSEEKGRGGDFERTPERAAEDRQRSKDRDAEEDTIRDRQKAERDAISQEEDALDSEIHGPERELEQKHAAEEQSLADKHDQEDPSDDREEEDAQQEEADAAEDAAIETAREEEDDQAETDEPAPEVQQKRAAEDQQRQQARRDRDASKKQVRRAQDKERKARQAKEVRELERRQEKESSELEDKVSEKAGEYEQRREAIDKRQGELRERHRKEIEELYTKRDAEDRELIKKRQEEDKKQKAAT